MDNKEKTVNYNKTQIFQKILFFPDTKNEGMPDK
jgi:hypothetical protein